MAVEGPAGLIASEAEAEVADVAVIRTEVGLETDDVEMEKVPVVCPWAIVMLGGTEPAALLLDKLT